MEKDQKSKRNHEEWDLRSPEMCVVINGNSKMTTREPRGLQWGNRIVL